MRSSLPILLLIIFFTGCVGTVQEAASPSNLQVPTVVTKFDFLGISVARPISHDKIEVEFFPAPGGADIAYKLFVNNATNPITIDPQALYTSTGGRLMYTLTGLNSNQEYKLKLTATNIRLNAISKNESEFFARTFDNRVSNFSGVSKVGLLEGQASSAIAIDWVAAPMEGIFAAGSFDTANYEVSIISEYGGAGNINNTNYTGTDRQVILVPTPPQRATPLLNPNRLVVANLLPDTTYYVQVRSINTLYQNYAETPGLPTIPVSRELNTRALTIKTQPNGSLFDFRQDNVVLTNALALDAFDKINVYWQAGSGSFTGYRIFARKYDGSGDPEIDDRLTEANLQSMNLSRDFTSVTSTDTSRRLTGLENGSWYQIKVALCKTLSCPVLNSDPNAAILSDLRAIRVKPTLAAFSGINAIEPPGQYNEKDVVRLRFDAPITSQGFANEIEFYCVDPSDKTRMVKFNGNDPITGSSISRCNGVYLAGSPPSIDMFTFQKVNGLITNGATEYCFAATPAIVGYGPTIRQTDMIVRCSFPLVEPPSVAQFPGVKNGCSVTGGTAAVEWSLPTGGIYSSFKVFWREKVTATKFSYADAIKNSAGYVNSGDLTAATVSYTVPNLIPGKTYQVGVLAEVEMPNPPNLFSEYNLNVVDCVMPLPSATFKGFTRIFAIGPRIDGRIPNDSTRTSPDSAAIYEAINANGIPFEVAMDSATSPNLTMNHSAPPGRDYNNAFNGGFDGIPDVATGYALSKRGIVSLAWEDVELSIPVADTMFKTNQPAGATPRSGRLWGYKIFRSHDNKLSWKELTTIHGNIYSMQYGTRNRPDAAESLKRMAFFTDYSVSSLKEYHDATQGRDIDRARVYYYRIVPVFNGTILKVANSNANIVKVTLPPPNMALVHRWMANRARCLELDKTYNINENYSCSYNGIGARPKSFPYRINETILDQKGDLLVDRNELGCRYTRGDRVADPATGASFFSLGSARRNPYDTTTYNLFRGFRSVGTTEDVSTPFKGCTGAGVRSRGTLGTAAEYPSGFTPEYSRLLQGDCMGPSIVTLNPSVCTAQQFADQAYSSQPIVVPGAGFDAQIMDCSANFPYDPSSVVTRLQGGVQAAHVAQSEFLAVYYNTYSGGMRSSQVTGPIEGPATNSLTARSNHNVNWPTDSGLSASQCSINLAAIDGSGYMSPRWASVNDLNENRILFKDERPLLISKTVNEITEVNNTLGTPTTLYNGVSGDLTAAEFKVPSPDLRISNRYRPTTRLSRILSSNSAKLPPLGRINPNMATAICGDYWVEVGAASDSGQFAQEAAPVRKRPLRRQESVTVSAWPETLDTNGVKQLEESSNQGSCNTTFKTNSGEGVYKGELIRNRSPIQSNTINGTPLLTGSSPYLGLSIYTDPNHTANCQSRYGIQDLVGNVAETNSERIFCDYSKDRSYMGPVAAGTWAGGAGAQNQGTGGPDLEMWNLNEQRNHYAVLKSGNIGGVNRGFEIRYRDVTYPPILNAKPWVDISIDSGYCSITDSDPVTRTGGDNPFANFEGIWNPLYLPGGALNTGIVKRTQPDQGVVDTWRNGDGRVLDFGPFGIGPALNRNSTLALSTSGITASTYIMQGKYFNPVMGLPLKCSDGSCNDPRFNQFNDNTSITLPGLAPNLVSSDDAPALTSFPIGNSQVRNVGISDFQFSTAGFDQVTLSPQNRVGTGITQMVTYVLYDDPITKGNPEVGTVPFPGTFGDNETVQYYRVRWDVERGSLFVITSGGMANESKAGRYTASFLDNIQSLSGTEETNRGFRCSVLINED